jgi:hypothetical protein
MRNRTDRPIPIALRVTSILEISRKAVVVEEFGWP